MFKTFFPIKPIQCKSTLNLTEAPREAMLIPSTFFCKYNDEIYWYNYDLIFYHIYDIEDYLFLYKSIDYWTYR